MEFGYRQTEVSNKIVELSLKHFQKSGYRSFSYRDLAKEIGIKTSSIHYYFPTKDDLAMAVVKTYRSVLNDQARSILIKASDPKARLQIYMDTFIESFNQEKDISFCAMLSADLENVSNSVKEEINMLFEDNINLITRVLEEGLRLRVFNFEKSPRELAEVIHANLEGATVTSRVLGNDRTLINTIELTNKLLENKDKGFISKYLSINK